MKNFFIGLLVLAAGTAVYFIISKKKKNTSVTEVHQEWIVGKWKPVSPLRDSAQPQYRYDFREDGMAIRSVNDSVKADTLHFAWKQTGELLLTGHATDSTGTRFTISKLTADSLEIKGADNVTSLFSKMK